MSVERDGKLTRFVCDGGDDMRGVPCRANYEVNLKGPLGHAWSEARAMGWVNTESGGVWQHYCPTCKKELGDD